MIRLNSGINKHRSEENKIREGSDKFFELLYNDKYFNALCVKYGYAITCHKAQGGEWDSVYVDFKGRNGISTDELRWAYTAMTRAKNRMYAINPPEISPFIKLEFSSIAELKNLPQDPKKYEDVESTPYHDDLQHPAKRMKYHEIKAKVENSPYSINRVESHPYQEHYFIDYDYETYRLITSHNKEGVFNKFNCDKSDETGKDIEQLLNSSPPATGLSDYESSHSHLNALYELVKNKSGKDVTIVNVIERTENYYVLYVFQIKDSYAVIQFYWDRNKMFTTAEPKIQGNDREARSIFNELLKNLMK